MILRINLLQYSEKIGYSWRQSTVTDGVCEHNTSTIQQNMRENGYEKYGYENKWVKPTVSQQGKLERRVQQQAGQQAHQ